MHSAVASPYLVPFDGSFRVATAPTTPPDDAPGKKALKQAQEESTEALRDLQRRLYAGDRHAVLCVFQALDAAGKDSTIRAVMSGVNPAGCNVTSFKRPSEEELDHDFLWRSTRALPRRGMIGIFNRSYYEEVLVVRVHPSILAHQRVTVPDDMAELWRWRLDAIADHEEHLARQGTVVLKFFLHVSRREQCERLIARIDRPEKNWKFEEGDLEERKHWDAYLHAYEEALNHTSRPWAPWYCIPADDKPFMRQQVADILVRTMRRVDPQYPQVDEDRRRVLQSLRGILQDELDGKE
ncbi:MAG: polyphosphate kinase 2 family protein [Alphaproteobacteria bacterium]|nr:polyphosphate kinase 2 family protein [Alphaproteobacteria bacterium]